MFQAISSSLISGSTINVVNGPLIKVDGSGSALDVTGALVNFGGTGGNTIIVRNGLCSGSCVTLGSPAINVFKPSGTITISGTSIKNSSLVLIRVNMATYMDCQNWASRLESHSRGIPRYAKIKPIYYQPVPGGETNLGDVRPQIYIAIFFCAPSQDDSPGRSGPLQ